MPKVLQGAKRMQVVVLFSKHVVCTNMDLLGSILILQLVVPEKIRLTSTVCDEIPLQMVPAILGILACVWWSSLHGCCTFRTWSPIFTPLFNERPNHSTSVQLRNISGKVEYVSWRQWQCKSRMEKYGKISDSCRYPRWRYLLYVPTYCWYFRNPAKTPKMPAKPVK